VQNVTLKGRAMLNVQQRGPKHMNYSLIIKRFLHFCQHLCLQYILQCSTLNKSFSVWSSGSGWFKL